MLLRGGTITKTDTLAVLNSFFEVVQEIIREGETINLINTHFSMQGVFEGATDIFDKNKHGLRLNVDAGKTLKEVIKEIPLEKTTIPEIIPHILEIKDSVSDSVNENITSQGVIEIIGSMLKIMGDNPANGINLLAAAGTAHKVATIVDNKPARLIVILPTLTAGEYTLQVTTQYNGGRLGLKVPRIAAFNKSLMVV